MNMGAITVTDSRMTTDLADLSARIDFDLLYQEAYREKEDRDIEAAKKDAQARLERIKSRFLGIQGFTPGPLIRSTRELDVMTDTPPDFYKRDYIPPPSIGKGPPQVEGTPLEL